MSYLPVRCDVCGAVSLAPGAGCARSKATCSLCLGAASVLPGCAYGEEDLGLFEDLRSYLERARLSEVEIWELAVMMDQLRLRPGDAQALTVLVESLPALAPALSVLVLHPSKLRSALSMLSILVDDRSYDRSSGAVQVPRVLLRQGA